MNIFNLFKKIKLHKKENKDISIEISQSIDEYFKKQKEFRQLKKADLPQVTDMDLRNAVMSWMWGKFNEDWSDQYEVLKTFQKPCQYVYACCTVVDEINNGGLNQLFFNSTGQFAEMAQEGFLEIGNEKLSEIMRSAIQVFNDNIKTFEKYDNGTIENFLESYDENYFIELDNDFFIVEPEFENLIEAYIRQNEIFFGD